MSVPKIVEITYAIYQGISDPRYDCVRNMSKEKSTTRLSPNFAENCLCMFSLTLS